MDDQATSFTPWYVWPNPAFHFRLWYQSPKCRIFLIENITHNWEWLSKYRDRIKTTDYFFVQLGWHFHYHFVQHTLMCVEALGLSKDQFRIMFPDMAAMTYFTQAGFKGGLVNHNCFLDYNLIKPLESEKLYDAIYTARFAPFKRHELASEVKNLALVAGETWGLENHEIPAHAYLNEAPLDLEGVLEKISQSRVGLILSDAEGACYSSSEYLLSGVPVVSTPSHGGRDIWYNELNSIIVGESPQCVAQGVKDMINRNPSPELIRSLHIVQSDIMRNNFIKLHEDVCRENGELSFDGRSYFEANFTHKLIKSQTPDFESLFNQHIEMTSNFIEISKSRHSQLEPKEYWSGACIPYHNDDTKRHHAMLDICFHMLKHANIVNCLSIGDSRARDAAYAKSLFQCYSIASDLNTSLLPQAVTDGFVDEIKDIDVEKIPYDDNSIDLVLAKETFHHWPRPFVGLYEMLRVAKRFVVLIEPNDCQPTGPSPYIEASQYHDSYEEVGNYKYQLSLREILKLSWSLGLPAVLAKGFNDPYSQDFSFEEWNARRLELDQLGLQGDRQFNLMAIVLVKNHDDLALINSGDARLYLKPE